MIITKDELELLDELNNVIARHYLSPDWRAHQYEHHFDELFYLMANTEVAVDDWEGRRKFIGDYCEEWIKYHLKQDPHRCS